MQKIIFMAVAGAIIGGITALLMTPESGSEIRRHLKTRALKQIDKVLAKAEQQLDMAHKKALQQKEPSTDYN